MSQNTLENISKNTLPRDTSVNTDFHYALSLQNEKKTDEALGAYQKILDQSLTQDLNLTREQASAISQNMALIYFQKKEPALAFVYNQKALYLSPSNLQATELSLIHI